jgi:hypothetical protein
MISANLLTYFNYKINAKIVLMITIGFIMSSGFVQSQNQIYQTPFEIDSNQTATYEEMIQFYQQLAESSEYLQLQEFGKTDIGKPLHLVVISANPSPDHSVERALGKSVVLINNAIHPGEPCGVDASMMLARNLAFNQEYRKYLETTTVLIIPAYNIGGMLNRNSYSRANQLGPESYGFRGNAQNLDLNRDFVKSDSRNARNFQRLFSLWKPQVFIDTHTTNGADYPYVMTLISTQKNQLGGPMANYMRNSFTPYLYKSMKNTPYPMCPYVFSKGEPANGIADFNDSPRFSTGYAALMHSMGFVSEAHMLKPFKDRVMSTYLLLKNLIRFSSENAKEIVQIQKEQEQYYLNSSKMSLRWKLDTTQCDSFNFHAYPQKKKPSKWSGGNRSYYDQSSAFRKNIPYYTNYESVVSCSIPKFYILPQAYDELISKLDDNGIFYRRLKKDTLITPSFYRIIEYETSDTPYEGHYVHGKVDISEINLEWPYYKGDVIIPTNQWGRRFIVNALEPHAVDSWFVWNFFDGILMQKEHFSPYVFEDRAYELLQEDPDLRLKLDHAKKEDPELGKSPYKQMKFIYHNSPHYEDSHLLYPVGRYH